MQSRRGFELTGISMIALALAGCPDADDRYQDFVDRVVDASPGGGEVDGMVMATLPDVTGDWLLAVRPNLPAELIIRFRVSFELTPVTENTGVLDLEALPLAVATGAPVGDPLVAEGVEVGADASFAAPLQGTLPGPANPVSGGPALLDAVLEGTVRSADFVCGTLSGMAGPLPLAGTTWAAVRITGETLPEAVSGCDAAPAP